MKNKALRYSIIGASILSVSYIAYLIFDKLHTAIIDAKTVTSEEADKLIKNI